MFLIITVHLLLNLKIARQVLSKDASFFAQAHYKWKTMESHFRKLVLAVHALQFSVSAAKEVQLCISGVQHIKVSLTVAQPYSLVYWVEIPIKILFNT